ncbi:MAG TPA: hypothetical protein VGO11_20675 [Chthoniobacteraceae bacterium]|nr:hypothetical protein [Chthoniobacteraceae bacterium]
MPAFSKFVFRTVDRAGRSKIVELRSRSAQEAKNSLLAAGARRVELLEDGMDEAIRTSLPLKVLQTTPAAERVALQKEGTQPGGRRVFSSQNLSNLFWFSLSGWLVWRQATGPTPWSPFSLVLYGAVVWAFVTLGRALVAKRLFDALLQARADYRWSDAVAVAQRVRGVNWFLANLIPESELLRTEAYALAHAGELSRALEHVQPLESKPGYRVFYLSMLGTIHSLAGDLEGHLRHEREAAALPLSSVDIRIGLAVALGEHCPDPAEAEQILSGIDEAEVKPLARYHYALAWGLVRLRQGRSAEAAERLREAVATARNFTGNALVAGHLPVLEGWHALALREGGERAEAEPIFAKVRPVLETRREKKLLQWWEGGRLAA